VLYSIGQQIWKTQQWSQYWKRSVFIPIPKKGNAKEYSNYHTIALISHASKVMLKIFQARLQQYMNQELPDIQTGFRKGRGTRDQIANIHWITERARKFQKNIYFCFIDYAKAFVLITTNSDGTPTLMAESEEELKNLLMKGESEKVSLKLNTQKTKIMHWSHHFMANR